MREEEIIQLWQSGLSKNKVAEIYRRRYNETIKIIRLEMHNRHAGRLIGNYEALAVVERVIYRKIKKEGGTNES